MESVKKIILLTGGGSGGHIYPLLAVAEALQKKSEEEKFGLELYYLGPDDEFSRVLDGKGIVRKTIAAAKIRRYFSFQNFLDVPKFFIGLCQALWKVFWLMPDVLFSKGGPGAMPVVLAAWFYRVPILIHDSDATPGVTTLLSSRFATRIAVSFEQTLRYFKPSRRILTGNPIRRELRDVQVDAAEAKKQLGFSADQPLTLILGASQGSRRINEFIVVNLPDILKETQILHQTGRANFMEVQKLSRAAMFDTSLSAELQSRYKPVGYFEEDMKYALAAADLIVARASSSTIFEISAFGKPAIFIPLFESANDHQRINAYEYAKTGAAVVIEENNLFPGIFLTQVREILAKPEVAEKMRAAARAFVKPDAAESIAGEVLALAGLPGATTAS